MTRPLQLKKRSALVPAVVAAIHIATATWVPFVHAQLDAQSASAVVETEHSPDCARTHSETSCASCAASHNVSHAQVRHIHEDLTHTRLAPTDAAERHWLIETFVRAHTVRAPPIS